MEQAVEQGHAAAQFALGVAYANGKGVLPDSVRAQTWFNIAVANGDASARDGRLVLEGELTPAQIAEATRRAEACMTSGYANC